MRDGDTNQVLAEILQLLHAATKIDFSTYRQSSVLQQAERRQRLLKRASLSDYAAQLRSNKTELQNLKGDILASSFEELQALNEELEQRSDEIAATRDYAEAISNTAREPLLILDQNFYVKSANPAFYKNFKTTKKNTVGTLLFELGNGQWDVPELRALLTSLLPQNEAITDFRVDYNFQSIGHRSILLNATTLLQGLGREPLIVLAFDDITERVKTERRMQANTEMFAALFNSNVLAIAHATTDGAIIDANKTFLKMFGYQHSDIKKGLHSKQLSAKGTETLTERIYESIRDHGESQPVEKRYIRKDGTTFIGLVGTGALPHNNNEFMAFILDRTEARELKELNQIKDEFIALASHQLRSPASVIKQYLGVIMQEIAGPVSEDQLQYLNVVNNANERSLSLLNDLLKTAEIDTKGFKLQFERSDVRTIIEACIAEYDPVFDQKKQRIRYNEPTQPLVASVDKLELGICINNLLENASKYSKPGSTITLKLAKRGHHIVVEVRDQGVGIADENIAKVFQKFTRINNELSDTTSGSGLGLYWVQRIIEAHNGDITIDSTLGKGTTFTVKLPI